MRASVRAAGLLIALAAAAWVFGLARTAAADIVTPLSADQPVSASLQESPPKPISVPEEEEQGTEGEEASDAPMVADEVVPAEVVPEEGAAEGATAKDAREPLPPPPVYTPVPEQVIERVTPATAPSGAAEARGDEAGVLGRVSHEVEQRLDGVGTFLERVVRACQVGVTQATGGPVVVFAVLSMVTALERRRTLRARLATDEDAPEFLYAWEVIAPG